MHRHSALETLYKVGKYSTNEKQSLTFKELKSLEILQIACWPDKIDEMNNLLSKEGVYSSLFLNRHVPIDLRDRSFSDLSSASTAIHHVSVKLFKISSKNYCLYIPRGFALSIWEILLETADQFGYEVLER